jgi:hypothetical protein
LDNNCSNLKNLDAKRLHGLYGAREMRILIEHHRKLLFSMKEQGMGGSENIRFRYLGAVNK